MIASLPVRKEGFESCLNAIQLKIAPLERFIHAFAGSLDQPLLHQSAKLHRGYRYAKPDVRHFCLLKAVRAVSGLNAAIVLARNGYTQEIAVIMRTLIECTTHIEFVLPLAEREERTRLTAEKYVEAYFADQERGDPADYKRAQVPQGTVHQAIGSDLDKIASEVGRTENYRTVNAAALNSNMYQNSSSYVHAKYPEVMDTFGGIPGGFHVSGMSGTPKDGENLEILDSFVTTVSNTIRLMILQLNLRELVQSDGQLAQWYADQAGE